MYELRAFEIDVGRVASSLTSNLCANLVTEDVAWSLTFNLCANLVTAEAGEG